MNDDTDVPPRSSRQNPAYRPTSDTPALHSQRIQSDARQIHTRSVAPYCCAIRALCRPIATQYGLRLRLCAHCVARIRLRYRPISRVALNTGSLSSRGCAPLTPGCILAPFQGALFPIAIFVTSAVGRCPFPLAIFVTSAVGRCPFPPRHICHICRRQMPIPPRHICHICRRQMSIPPRHICHICRRQMSIPPRHLWRGGWPTGRG